MGAMPPVSFPTDSRYYGFAHADRTPRPTARPSPTWRAAIVPQPGAPNYATVAQHTVMHGDRLDLLAANYLGDPLMFWLICDANGAIRPGRIWSKRPARS